MLAFQCLLVLSGLPSLRPTAGYPADARRFKEEIAQVQATEKISDTIIVAQSIARDRPDCRCLVGRTPQSID